MNSNNSNNSKIAPIGNVSLYYSNNPLGYWSWRRENRKGQLTDLAGIIRRNPRWLFRAEHRRMIAAMIARVAAETLQKVLPELERDPTLDSEAPENRLDQIGQSDKGQ